MEVWMVHVRPPQKWEFYYHIYLLRGGFTFNFCSPTMRCIQKYLNTSVAYFLSHAGIIAIVLKHPVLVCLH